VLLAGILIPENLRIRHSLIGTPAPIGEPLNSTLLVAIEDLVAGLAGDPELPAEFRHGLAG